MAFLWGLSLACGWSASTHEPEWWQTRGVLRTEQLKDDYGIVNQGQLKAIASQAFDEFEAALPGGAGTALQALMDRWTRWDGNSTRVPLSTEGTEDYAPVNIGQLKSVSALFYERLYEAGVVRGLPWGWGREDDFALANIGQLKALFAFNPNPSADADGNVLPDAWELRHFGFTGSDPDQDADGDGISNRDEFEGGTSPVDFYNGSVPVLEAVSVEAQESVAGALLPLPLVLRVTGADGRPVAGAPVTFMLVTGRASGAIGASPERQTALCVTVVSDAFGEARAYFRQPLASGNVSRIEASSGAAARVTFLAHTTGSDPDGGALFGGLERPEFSLNGGSYQGPVHVVLESGYPEATIYFTTNGEEPTTGDFSLPSGGSIAIDSTLMLRARVCVEGVPLGPVQSALFTIGSAAWTGISHTLALDQQRSLWSWGSNLHGELGLGHLESQNAPSRIPSLGEIVSAATGRMHSLAVTADGILLSWGGNAEGQLGLGHQTDRPAPVRLAGMPPVVTVSAGASHSVALCKDGSVWTWGANDAAQLGHGALARALSPVRVPDLNGIQAIATGADFTLAVDVSGRVWSWGAGNSGQLGSARPAGSRVPSLVPGLEDVVAVCAGSQHALALRADGSVWAWGKNDNRQVAPDSVTVVSSPTRVEGLGGRALGIAAGSETSYVRRGDNVLLGWGRNEDALLGKGADIVPEPFVLLAEGYGKLLGNGGKVLLLKDRTDSLPPAVVVQAPAQEEWPSSVSLRIRMRLDWQTQQERYRFSGYWFTEEEIDVLDSATSALGPVEFEGIYTETNFSTTALPGAGPKFYPVEVVRREDAGGYEGPPVNDISELAKRMEFTVVGDSSLLVQVIAPDSQETPKTLTYGCSFERGAFFGALRNEQAPAVVEALPLGCTLKFTAPNLRMHLVGGYRWNETLSVALEDFLPQENRVQLNQMYLLFKVTNGGANCELLGAPVGAQLKFDALEDVYYVLAPILLLQNNYPLSQETTDLGPARPRPILSGTSSLSTAWITGAPAMPDLEVRVGDGLPSDLKVEWCADITSERMERERKDNVHIPQSSKAAVFSQQLTAPWKLTPHFTAPFDFVGGVCELKYRIKTAAGEELLPPRQMTFRIRGKNPRDYDALGHILNTPTKIRFAWAMVQHESRQQGKGVSRVYNQFNSGGATRELPNFSGNFPKEDGWGMAQLDRPLDVSAPAREVYNWQLNLQGFQREIAHKQKTAAEYVELMRSIYAPLGQWEEPPEAYVRPGTSTPLTSSEAAVIQLYNGAAWLVEMSGDKKIYDGPYTSVKHGGRRYLSCWKYNATNPAGQRWEFIPNQNNYVFKVINDEWEGRLWYQE